MSSTKRIGLLAGAAAATLASGTLADTDVSKDDLLQRLAAAEAKLAEISNAQNDEWLTEQRASEIRQIVSDVLGDAETRASLLQGSAAGWDNGFTLRSSDGNNELNVSGQIQVRYTWNHRDENSGLGATSGRDDFGFENRRTKLSFSGHVVDPSWQYKVTGAFGRAGGVFALEDAYVKKTMDNGSYIRAGQFKAPYMREELVSSKHQLAVDRSVMNELFNQGFTQGVEFGWSNEQFRLMAMFHDGHGNANSASIAAGQVDFGASARFEFLAQGTWDQFKDFTSPRGSETGILVGAAVNYETDESGDAIAPNDTRFGVTVDASLEMDGWNLYGALMYVDSDNGGTFGAATGVSPFAFVLQGGYYLTDDWEIFARYEFGDLDGAGTAAPTPFDELSIVTVGVNKYFNGAGNHNLKWTTDLGIALDEIDPTWGGGAANSVGYLADGQDSQIVFRTQFQLLF